MAKVTYITPTGEKVVVEKAMGTLMEAAVEHDVEGIEGACGGVCSCGTCHVVLPEEWMERLGQPEGAEKDLLELEENAGPRSRLSCQMEASDELDGIEVQVAPLE